MKIDEFVSVDLLSNHVSHEVFPWVFSWRGRKYKTSKVGLHHKIRDGRTLMHIFTVTDGTSCFRLQFDTDTLGWKLLDVTDQ